jgi:hypothetical protein
VQPEPNLVPTPTSNPAPTMGKARIAPAHQGSSAICR